ncbi:two-component system, sensor histidine kinase PdtaS [Thermoflexales bacterium]|nr:two-component system, sensor histidine kinase PdtaS [Thermoflexales bacterium]
MTTGELHAQHDVRLSRAMSSLREIAQALSAAWDLDTTLDLIAHRTEQVMQVNSCSIYLLEPGSAILRLRASTRLARDAIGRAHLLLGEGLTGWAAQHSQAVAERNAQADPRFKFLPETREQKLHSLLAVPLVNRERVIGAMNVQTAEAHDFTTDEIELLSLIGDLAAGALDRAILYDRMNRQIAELTTLAKVSEAVTSPLYLDEMLDLVVEMAAKVMGAPICSLRLIDDARGELVVHALDQQPAYWSKPLAAFNKAIADRVIAAKKPMTIENLEDERPAREDDPIQQEQLVSLLAVPLVVREKAIGVLSCYTNRPRDFTESDIVLFSTLANQTALAIENARLVTNAAVVREMHHRIKNNLQTVAMLLRMQAASGEQLSARDVLQISVNRILSIAAVHEILSQEGFRFVDVKDVAHRIAQLTAQNMLSPDRRIAIHVTGEAIVLPSKPATSLALVINELLQNALEHAFVGQAQGAVTISLSRSPHHFIIEVSDDGVGLPQERPASTGLEIVETLVRDDLRGKIAFKSGQPGTHVIIRLRQSIAELEA